MNPSYSLQFVPTNWITWFSPRTLTPFETHVLAVIRTGSRVNFPTIINALISQGVKFPSCYPANLSVLGALSYLTVSGLVIEHDDYTYSIAPQRPARACRVCGCTDLNCSQCIARTGHPCSWVEPDLCSACVNIDKTRQENHASR